MEFFKELLWKQIVEIFCFNELQTVKSKLYPLKYKFLSSKYISARK